jgi:hypothetical protein
MRRICSLQLPVGPSGVLQARYLREMNQSGNHEAVIQLFESGRLAHPEAVLSEYVAALARTNRLDNTRLLETLQVRAQGVGWPRRQQ